MATRIDTVVRLNGGAVTVQLDWDDANRRYTTLRVINTQRETVRVELRRHGGATVGRDFPTGTTTLALPASGAARLFRHARGDGAFDNCDIAVYGLGDG